MYRLLVVSFGREGLAYVRLGRQRGMSVRVLDCVDRYHRQLVQWYGDDVLQVAGRRADVRAVVAREAFDAAIVHEDSDFIRTALITQSLREAGVRTIVVVTPDISRRMMYRRCGAHRIVVATTPEQAWTMIDRYLPAFATA
ncbi:MAG: hypothetical protein IRZ33_00705 [Alicyclobacillaceae bacterium]|nr:hypothetical protein [Alicyclobacillaceae bacterium]